MNNYRKGAVWSICLFFCFRIGMSQSIPFAFLGIESDHQPDIAQKLKKSVIEQLGNIKKIDVISENEISEFRTRGIMKKGIPDEAEARKLTEIIGPVLIFSVYLNKIAQTASNTFWPPFSAEATFTGEIDLFLMESTTGKVLFSGSVEAASHATKWFASVDSPEDRLFIDAIDRDKVINSLIVKLSEIAVKRIKQLLLEFSFKVQEK